MARYPYYSGMPSKKYWELRSKELLSESFSRAEDVEKYLIEVYRQNLLDFISEYQDMMLPYVDCNGDIDFVAFSAARKSNPHLDAKLSRLEAQVEVFTKELAKITDSQVEALLITNYKLTMQGISNGLNVNLSYHLLNNEAIKQAVHTPFTSDGREFSDRIWTNLNDMNRVLRKELSDSIARGDSIVKTSKRMQEIFGKGAYETQRLIRTETLATYCRASLETYKNAGIEKLEVLGEKKPCDRCKTLNRFVEVKSAVVGVNIPPAHPWQTANVVSCQ